MREILFRGKRFDTGEWVEGWLFQNKHNSKKYFIRTFPYQDDEYEDHVVDPKTIGQYTGVNDKSGTKIFEGDIIKFPKTGVEVEVIFYDGAFGYTYFGFYPLKGVVDYNTRLANCIVIGNIHVRNFIKAFTDGAKEGMNNEN